MIDMYFLNKAISAHLHSKTKRLSFFLLLIITPFCYADQLQQLYDIKPKIYSNAEAALTELDQIKSTIKAENRKAMQWYWIRKAEAEAVLILFDDMALSLASAELADDLTDSEEAKTQLLLLKGLLAQNNGELSLAKQFFNQTISIAKKAAQKRLELHARVELAYTYTLEDNFQQALSINQQAHLDALTEGDNFISALAEDVYGAIYGYMDQYQESIEYYKKALSGYQKLGFDEYSSSAIFGIATSNRYWEKYDEAIKYFNLYEKILSKTNKEGSKFYARYGIATTLAAAKNCTQALPALEKALATTGPADYKAELFKLQAKCFLQENNSAAAKKALSQAEAIFESLPDLKGTNWQIETIKIHSDIEKANKNWQLALELHSTYHDKKLELDTNIYSEKLIATKTNLENQQKNLEIQLLTKNATVQELTANNQIRANQQQRNMLIALTCVTLIIFIFALILYRNYRRISELSIRDDLTGLYNRRHVFNYLNELLSTNKEENQFSIIVVDIDDFKQINDQHGHLAGDSIIKKIASTSVETLRKTDVIGRIGGEEFLYILPRTTPEQCETIAHRLLDIIREKRFSLPSGKIIKVTVSMGICHNHSSFTDAKILFQLADDALYQSKNNGKNQINIVENK